MSKLNHDAALVETTQRHYRERLASFIISHSLSTGHGDTFDDLLIELGGQIKELQQRAALLAEARERIPDWATGINRDLLKRIDEAFAHPTLRR